MGQTSVLFVGSLTRYTPSFDTFEGEGISILRLDEETGEITPRSLLRGIDNPTFLTFHGATRTLFATTEVFGWNEGTITAYHYDKQAGRLTYINRQMTRGGITAHQSLDRSGLYVLVTNYAHEQRDDSYGDDLPGQAVAVLPIGEEGCLGPVLCTVAHRGSGPIAHRQSEPHPHCAIPSPDNRFVLVADLGTDTVTTYRFDEGVLTRSSEIATAPGAGPRHLVFSGDGKSVYLINELDSTMAHLTYDAETGVLAIRQVIKTIPADFIDENRCSDLQLSKDGRFLYGANRGHDSVAVFSVDQGDGHLELIETHPCGGRTPRQMALSASDGFLLVANQNSHTVAVLRRDKTSGRLHQVAEARVGTPMAIVVVPE